MKKSLLWVLLILAAFAAFCYVTSGHVLLEVASSEQGQNVVTCQAADTEAGTPNYGQLVPVPCK